MDATSGRVEGDEDGRWQRAHAVDGGEGDDSGDRGHRHRGSNEPEQDFSFAWRCDLESPPAASDQSQTDEEHHCPLIHGDPVPARVPTRSVPTDRSPGSW